MSTSLAEQLNKLRAPQTSILLQNKKRPSLLFDPKEAADLDRENVLNIGQSGLEDLSQLCDSFGEFKGTLFSRDALNLERSVEDSIANARLNAGIEKFLILLSPYFMLNSAHKALEWLIHRFRIHEYNRKEFMLLILPYHETRIFVRALQLFDLSANNDRWKWLEGLQKPGVPLSSLTLINRAATDNGLLKLLCRHVVQATMIFGDKANRLSTLYAFYTTLIVGALERTASISEIQTSHVLSSLTKGLTSSIRGFQTSSYLILGKLCTRASIEAATLDHLILKLMKNPQSPCEAVLLILFIYENSLNRPTRVSEKVALRVAKSRGSFVEHLSRMKLGGGLDVTIFMVPLIRTCLELVIGRTPEESHDIRSALEEIFLGTSFDDTEIDLILECMVKPYDDIEMSEETKIFLANLFEQVEKRYPSRFDEYVNNLMRKSENDTSCKMTLQLLMRWHSRARNAKDSLDILNRLNHPSPYQRIAGLEIIARGEVEITETFREMVNKALIARFSDQDSRVVKTLLKLPREGLMKSLFPRDTLVDELMILLAQCNSQKQRGLAKLAIELLLDICEDVEDDTSIFIATMPYLFPSRDEEIDISMEILRSKYSENNRYMKKVREDMGGGGKGANAEAISSAAFHNILKWELLPPIKNIVGTIKSQSCRGDATSMFFNLLLLGSVCRVPVGSLSNSIALEIIEIAAEMTKYYPKVRRLGNCNQLNADKISEALALTSEGILPLQACTYVIEMVHRRIDINKAANASIDFENDQERAILLLRLLEILFEGMSLPSRRAHYSWCLKIFFQRHFSSSREILVFLSQFFTAPVNSQTSLHCLKISLDILESTRSYNWIFEDRVFVPNLLVGLARPNDPCRLAAVEILKKISQTFNLTMPGFSSLLHELANKSADLSIDPEQLSLLMYTLLSPDPDVIHQLERESRKNLEETRKSLIRKIIEENTCVRMSAQLLQILTHVNAPEILVDLSKFGLKLYKRCATDAAAAAPPDSKKFSCQALRNIFQRFNSTSVESLLETCVFEIFDLAMSDHRPIIPIECTESMESAGTHPTGITRRVSPSSIMIKQIDQEFYERARKVSPLLARKIFFKLVDVVTECEIGAVVAACNRAVRRIKIDASMVVEELRRMKNARLPESECTANSRSKRRSRGGGGGQPPRPEVTDTGDWKRGITILEFVQRAENIENEKILIPMLFEILRVSLSFEIQNPLEYVNQLVLSTIYHLTTKGYPINEAHIYIDLIAQCIRISHNPQTHHHALLVLVELFKTANVETALHNIMPIFTFMGSSVLRQDDAYSIQIISKTIETIVPIVTSANDAKHACEIIRIFVVSLPHIPEHRRIPVFIKLLQLLDKHLHIFYLVTFDAHVTTGRGPLLPNKVVVVAPSPARKNSSERLEFALRISHEFSAPRILQVSIEILKFVRSLPIDIENETERKKIHFSQKYIFDVANNSPKQLRHYKYTVVQFLVALLTSHDFVNKVATIESATEVHEIMEPLYDRAMVEIILLIESFGRSADLHHASTGGNVQAKYWKVLLHNIYDIFDAVNNLLPNSIFVSTVTRLLAHDLSAVRKKALELLNLRLHQKKFNVDDHQRLLPVVDSLREIVDNSRKGKIFSPELEIIQQTALISLKLMAKLLATDNPGHFKPVLDLTTELMKTKEGPLLASSVLCTAELCASMRTHAIKSLNKFVPAVIRLLKVHCNKESPDFVVVSIVSALQKIVESVGNFLSLYLDQLLLELTRLSSVYTDTENPKIGLVASKLKGTSEKLASSIPMRVLLPAVSETYDLLIASKLYRSVQPLLNIIGESFGNVPTNELQASIPDLAKFFLKVLQFREEVEIVDTEMATSEDVSRLEESASRALVALVLKLSEATFRPLYYKLYDWAARFPEKKQRNITFYRLSANIAERLKSLFVLFAGHFLKHASSLLRANNLAVTEEPCELLTLPEESRRIELIEAILLTLYRVFGYDAHNFVNQERFQVLAQPIVDQLENTAGTRQEFEKRACELIVPCVAAFAGAIQDDSLHKQLVYQTLLKTRHTKPYVRSAALGALVEIARKLGEDFMPLLPETVPFLAELLEDEDESTEKIAQNAVRTLEDILGEPLQKYF
ncbi:HEAT repeat-containing protein 1 [Venturia canescens]|uniref:HEAT repeat-containing protein 1 n=1 Tax=Venturia canescens TaxID=32260 RepID=UPI001C9CADC9|nr:HEAT repeat-containing protein 1 [Venturia canescens]XP_043288105.1 HEAT repeat-containing protein 1 [Venturia canescens]